MPLDIRGFFIEPGEHGMLKPNPHILHPPVPFKFPADSLQMMEWFPLGMDAGHIARRRRPQPGEATASTTGRRCC